MPFSMPPTPGPARDNAILDAVRAGLYTMQFCPLTVTENGHTAVFMVFQDALKVDDVRINVSARLQQTIADMLGCSLLTPKLADLLWVQRGVTLNPFPQPITSATSAMISHSAKIDAALAKLSPLSPTGFVQTVGKHWVIDNDLLNHLGRAENYGWHFTGSGYQGITGEVNASLQKDPHTGQYIRLIQGRGWAHDMEHVDYSQTCVLVWQTVTVDGVDMPLQDLLSDPVLASLASHQGKMKVFRQPGVPLVPLLPQLSTDR